MHNAVDGLPTNPWPHFDPGAWTPHITTGWALTSEQFSVALPMVLEQLPFDGWFDTGGIEDGTTGENWRSEVSE